MNFISGNNDLTKMLHCAFTCIVNSSNNTIIFNSENEAYNFAKMLPEAVLIIFIFTNYFLTRDLLEL